MIIQNDKVKIDRELLLDFFLTFSKFEYALKAGGFAKRGRRSDGAEPNWDSFALELRDSINSSKNLEFLAARNYFLQNPPRKQILKENGELDWGKPQSKRQCQSDVEFLLLMVRCVRNNLFHGGKHNNGLQDDKQRGETLLSNSLIILNECLRLSMQVKNRFDRAII